MFKNDSRRHFVNPGDCTGETAHRESPVEGAGNGPPAPPACATAHAAGPAEPTGSAGNSRSAVVSGAPLSLAEKGLDMLHAVGCDTTVWDCLTPFERIELGARWERWKKSFILRPNPQACLAAIISAGLAAMKAR